MRSETRKTSKGRPLAALLALAVLCVAPAATTESKVLRSGAFTVTYAPQDAEAARAALETLEEARAAYERHLPAGDAPIHLVIPASHDEFRTYAGFYAQPAVAGLARPAEGLIVVKPPRLRQGPGDFGGTVRHELLHILLERNVDTDVMPAWFNEGVCMKASEELRWATSYHVARMYVSGDVMTLSALNSAFRRPGDEHVFGNAYAQSLSLTQWLYEAIGEERFWRLVTDLGPMSFEESLASHAGMTPAELVAGWRDSLWKIALVTSLVSGFTVFNIMAILAVAAYLRRRAKDKRILRRMDREERQWRRKPQYATWDEVVAANEEYIEFEEDDEW